MQWFRHSFETLPKQDLYAILRLRSDIFVVEQDCVYLDLDNQDQSSYHLYAKDKEGAVAAYVRILPTGTAYPQLSIGRVVVEKSSRGKELGIELMVRAEEWAWDLFEYERDVVIMAQSYLLQWYCRLGYVAQGEEFLEDGIPHRIMIKSNK